MKSASISDGLKREKIYLQLETRGVNLRFRRKEDTPVAIQAAVLLFFRAMGYSMYNKIREYENR